MNGSPKPIGDGGQSVYLKTLLQAGLLDRLADLVFAGAKAAMVHYGRAGDVRFKADNTPLTAADLEVDDILCAGLAAAFPRIVIVTEERAASHGRPEPNRPFFLVDPIDGTKEFVNRHDDFTINIALIEDGAPVAGVVGAPARGEMYVAALGVGAFRRTFAADASQVDPPAPIAMRPPDNERLTALVSRSHADPATQAFIDANPVGDLRAVGSSLKFCLLAAGEADVYPRFGPTMEWDTAAGHAVLAAAGGVVSDPAGAPLQYGKPKFRNTSFIAHAPSACFVVPAELR